MLHPEGNMAFFLTPPTYQQVLVFKTTADLHEKSIVDFNVIKTS